MNSILTIQAPLANSENILKNIFNYFCVLLEFGTILAERERERDAQVI